MKPRTVEIYVDCVAIDPTTNKVEFGDEIVLSERSSPLYSNFRLGATYKLQFIEVPNIPKDAKR